MKKGMMAFAAGIAAISTAVSAPNGQRSSQNHVPKTLVGVRAISPEAAKFNHIVLVNVAGAIPDEDWTLATTYAVSLLQINVWTNSISSSVADRLSGEPSSTAAVLKNAKSKIGVYFENKPDQAAMVTAAPGFWCVVNIAALKKDSPSLQTYRDRVAKCVMKGLAAAAGGGATLEPFCSLFYGAQTLEGMDKTNIAISPMCYFPMLEILRGVGGSEMITPATAETEVE